MPLANYRTVFFIGTSLLANKWILPVIVSYTDTPFPNFSPHYLTSS